MVWIEANGSPARPGPATASRVTDAPPRSAHDARMNSRSPELSPLDDPAALSGAWLAARVEEDPAWLGLGDGMPAFERTVVHARPDQFAVILFHPADGVRHIVEVQLGAADIDQVDRAVRHLEEESSLLPLIPHRAAVAAERIPDDVLAAAWQARVPVDVVALQVEPSGELATVHGEARPSPVPDGPAVTGP
ncbi:hypothetical protein ACVWWH_003843 [Sinomonas sp. RB5]